MTPEPSVRSANWSKDLTGLAQAYLSLAADAWRTSLRISCGYQMRAANRLLIAARDPGDPQEFLSASVLDVRNYVGELASIVPFALENMIDAGDISSQSYSVLDKPVMLPARIKDASQGWALYFVSAEDAQAHLDKQTDAFTVVDVGGKRTPVSIFGVDYRQTDLGTYSEIGVVFFVRPRHDTSAIPGILFLSLTVNQEFTRAAADTIWGYHKTLSKGLAVQYNPASAAFWIDANDATALSASFPRFGSGRSTDVPCYTYSLKSDAHQKPRAHRTLFSRSGIGEGVQIRGNVQLTLGDGTQKNCACQLEPAGSNKQACVCLMLRDLGVSDQLPAANGWSEHMSGALEAPLPTAVGASRTQIG
jgi:hypothetical protein